MWVRLCQERVEAHQDVGRGRGNQLFYIYLYIQYKIKHDLYYFKLLQFHSCWISHMSKLDEIGPMLIWKGSGI